MTGTVVAVSVGKLRDVIHNGRKTQTGIWKSPVDCRVALRDHAVDGDTIANLENHGGEHKAVYVYSTDDSKWWRSEHGRIVLPGAMGENLTVSGIEASTANVGDRWSIGSAVLEVAGPRTPCFKLGLRHDDQDIVEEFRNSLRWGAYMRIITEGDVGKGDEIVVTPSSEPTIGCAEIARIYHSERHRVGELLNVPRISPEWPRFAEAEIAKQADESSQ